MTALSKGQGDDDVLTAGGLVNLNGAAVRFDASGVLHWPEERLLVVLRQEVNYEIQKAIGRAR